LYQVREKEVPLVKGLLTALTVLSLVGCAAALEEARKPCTFSNPSYSAKVKVCRDRIEIECKTTEDGIPLQDCPVLVECRAWKAKECGE
jgi:hypothetical protein